MAPSHYQNQCWLATNVYGRIYIRGNTQDINLCKKGLKITIMKLPQHLSGANELIEVVIYWSVAVLFRSPPGISLNLGIMESPPERPASALARGVQITEFKGNKINPDPVNVEDSEILLEEYLSPRKLVRSLVFAGCGCWWCWWWCWCCCCCCCCCCWCWWWCCCCCVVVVVVVVVGVVGGGGVGVGWGGP